MEQKTRVIVCGVGFGQFYLRALEKLKDAYELVGIFSKGSEWSKACAEQYGVPLFTDLDQITKDIVDVVCVVIKSTVVGGNGSHIVHTLLSKGIHVIQEHPVHLEDYISCMKLAKQNQCQYRLNTFYPELTHVRQFIELASKLRGQTEISYISATCSVHVLFPLIDILGRVTGGLRPWTFNKIETVGAKAPFSLITGTLHHVPICLQVQNQIEPNNPEDNLFLLHSITVNTPCGNLMLTGTNSMVVWESCMSKKVGSDGVLHLDAEDPYLDLPICEVVSYHKEESYRSLFQATWPESIKRALEDFNKAFRNNQFTSQEAQYIMGACEVWQDLAKVIGPAELIKSYTKKPLQLKDLI